MSALLYAGIICVVAVTSLFAAAFFVQAWRLRPGDAEYFIFGLVAVCASAYALATVAAYVQLGLGGPPRFRSLANVGAAAAVASVALLIHFTLRFVRSRQERKVMRVVYPLMGIFAVTVGLDLWWAGPMRIETMSFWGVSLPVIRATPSWVPMLFFACEAIVYPAVIVTFARNYRSGRRESAAALEGTVLLLATVANDILGPALGLFGAPPLLPIGFLAFAFAMGITLVNRYGSQSQALARRQTELEQRSRELASALAELEETQANLVHAEQLAVVGEFAAVITHEVRNPMQIVTSAVSSLRRVRGVTDHTRSLLGIIEEEMSRLERLVSHLLDYARPVVPQTKPIDLEVLLRGALKPLEAFPDIEATLLCVGTWPELEADADMLRHAIDNVITNAVQAMDGRGALCVRVARRKVAGIPCVVVGFEDSGEGMTEQQLEQAGMPFYTSRPSGTGLGLSICDRIVEAHGGRLVLASERGAGTAISLILPVTAGERLERP